jgi:hypothetical protein
MTDKLEAKKAEERFAAAMQGAEHYDGSVPAVRIAPPAPPLPAAGAEPDPNGIILGKLEAKDLRGNKRIGLAARTQETNRDFC